VYKIDPEAYADCFHACRSRSLSTGHIDKQKLLEIARKNAMNLLKQGVLPTSVVTQDKMVAIKAGGKSVAELTGKNRICTVH
jgi:hypothetical protein